MKLRQELRTPSTMTTRPSREKLSEDEREVKNMLQGEQAAGDGAGGEARARADAGGGTGGEGGEDREGAEPKATPKAAQAKGPAAAPIVVNELICRRVQRFWPDEGGWFDAIITDYRPTTNEHCLTYEINTPNETFEWADISQFDGREFKLLEDRVNIEDLKFYSQGMKVGAGDGDAQPGHRGHARGSGRRE